MKKMFLMAAAAAIVFASCTKEGTPSVDNGNFKSITVKIVNTAAPDTRASGSATAANTSVVDAADLTAYFYAGNTYVTFRTLDSSVTGTVQGGQMVYDEYVFNGLPGNVDNVVFSNMPEAQATAWLANGTLPTDMATWNPAGGNVKKTPVAGKNTSAFTYVDQTVTNNVSYRHYQTELTVDALFARLEVSGIQCTDLGDERFSALGLEALGIMYGNDKAAWDAITGTSAWQKDAFPTGTALTTNAAQTGVYVYNVAPGTVPSIVLSVIKTGTTSSYPNLVDNLNWPYRVKTGALYEGTDKIPANLISTLAPGTVYQIKYAFTDDDVKPWTGPEPSELICVDVKVTVKNWVVKTVVSPEFN